MKLAHDLLVIVCVAIILAVGALLAPRVFGAVDAVGPPSGADAEAVALVATPAPAVAVVAASGSSGWRTSGSSFYDWNTWGGRRTACGLAYTRDLLGVAHRSLPCGTIVEFRHGGTVVSMPVVDRGPYVAGREWDFTSAGCLALHHCWTGPIQWRIPGGTVVAPRPATLPITSTEGP